MGNTDKNTVMETNENSIPNFRLNEAVFSNQQSDPTNRIDPGLIGILKDIRENNQLINKKLDILVERQDKTDEKIEACANESRRAYHDLENSTLRHELEFLEKENELLYRQANFQNLILIGLSDTKEESDYDIFQRVTKKISTITDADNRLDTVYKIGYFKNESNRPIRIRFLAHNDRNLAYECRKHLTDNMTLNEDLPFRVRQDLFALRKKRAELFQDKIKHTINWKTKTITIRDGPDITVKDGNIAPMKRRKIMTYLGTQSLHTKS